MSNPMQNTMKKDADPSGGKSSDPSPSETESQQAGIFSIFDWLKGVGKQKNSGENLRDVIEEYMEDLEDGAKQADDVDERTLITNVLNLRDSTVVDVMIPRADIVAIDVNITPDDLMALLAEKQFSRLPVYKGTLDEVIGTVHIKDLIGLLATRRDINIRELIRDVPIVSPSMTVMNLMLMMRETKKHMALVVDEYGGIDGLVTIGDVIEAIVGEIDDEFVPDTQPEMIEKTDGSIHADARVSLEEFEERFGTLFSEEEREECDTLGGLVFTVAGRVPSRGEVLKHPSGLVFEVLDADLRRINRLRVKNIPPAPQAV